MSGYGLLLKARSAVCTLYEGGGAAGEPSGIAEEDGGHSWSCIGVGVHVWSVRREPPLRWLLGSLEGSAPRPSGACLAIAEEPPSSQHHEEVSHRLARL